MNIWYRVRDLDRARAFYADLLGFEELYYDGNDRWMRLARDGAEVSLVEGEGPEQTEAVLTVEVPDVRAEGERLRAAGVEVGTVVEIPGTIRVLDVFDPDGNRVQLTQDLEAPPAL